MRPRSVSRYLREDGTEPVQASVLEAMKGYHMKKLSGMLAMGVSTLMVTSALAAPPMPMRPPVLTPVPSGTAEYTQEVECKASVQIQVAAYDVPANWGSYGQKAIYRGSEVYFSQSQGKDYMSCHYVAESQPEFRLTSIWSFAEKGACIANPTKPGFLCKRGTVPTIKPN
jgi:hypothetical protein